VGNDAVLASESLASDDGPAELGADDTDARKTVGEEPRDGSETFLGLSNRIALEGGAGRKDTVRGDAGSFFDGVFPWERVDEDDLTCSGGFVLRKVGKLFKKKSADAHIRIGKP
jgi:hypothetical protein